MNALQKQAGTVRVVLFVRVEVHAYEVGVPGWSVVFEPRANGRAAAAWLHRVAEARGRWIDCTEMLDGNKARPGACVRQALKRAADAIDLVSPTLALVLRTVETSEQVGARVLVRLPARAGGLAIETRKPVPSACLG